MKLNFVLIGLLVLLAGAIAFAIYGWTALEGTQMGFHGWIALGLGVGLTALVGGGLGFLVFFSSRSGRDDDHHYGDYNL